MDFLFAMFALVDLLAGDFERRCTDDVEFVRDLIGDLEDREFFLGIVDVPFSIASVCLALLEYVLAKSRSGEVDLLLDDLHVADLLRDLLLGDLPGVNPFSAAVCLALLACVPSS